MALKALLCGLTVWISCGRIYKGENMQLIDKENKISEKAILQIDEDEVGGLIFKATFIGGTRQVQFHLTRIEKIRLEQYFKERENDEER